MLLAMALLVLLVVGIATLITALEQRQSLRQLHATTARQVRATVSLTVSDLHTILLHVAALDAGAVDQATLNAVIDAQPAVRSLDYVAPDGRVAHHAPAESAPGDWHEHPAFQAAASGALYASLSRSDPQLVLIAGPGPSTGSALIARVDAAILWRGAVVEPVGTNGYACLLSDSGAILARRPGVTVAEGVQPQSFDVVRRARDGGTASRIYRGIDGRTVIGYAQHWPDLGMTVIVETPLSDLLPVAVRVVGLWGLAFLLTLGLGEWLIRRNLHSVTVPLDRLGDAARAVAAGDYHYRVRLPPGTDREFAALGDAFNHMIARLAESRRELDAYAYELQELVDRRARELSRKTRQMEVAADVSRTIAKIHDPRVLVVRVAELIRARFEFYHIEVLLVNHDTGAIAAGEGVRDALEPLTLHDATSSVIAWVASSGEMLYVPDVTREPRYRRSDALPASRSELAIPLVYDGTVLGVLNLESEHRDAFPPDLIEVLQGLADQIAVSLYNAQAFRKLEQANSELAQGTLQANQANILKSRFLYRAVQTLRPPLDAIVSAAETLLSGVAVTLPPEAVARLRAIRDQGRVMQALIEDMHDLSAIEAGHMQLQLDWIALPPLLEEVTNAARALHMTAYPDHELAITLDLLHRTEPLPPVWADIDRLRYILINLMSNAVKFTEAGQVVLSADTAGSDVLITVRDTGPGLSEEELRYLFEPFQHQRAPAVDPEDGTGLGLPVARLLAMRHGGDLTVETTPGAGNTFVLRLPIRPDGAPPPPD